MRNAFNYLYLVATIALTFVFITSAWACGGNGCPAAGINVAMWADAVGAGDSRALGRHTQTWGRAATSIDLDAGAYGHGSACGVRCADVGGWFTGRVGARVETGALALGPRTSAVFAGSGAIINVGGKISRP